MQKTGRKFGYVEVVGITNFEFIDSVEIETN